MIKTFALLVDAVSAFQENKDLQEQIIITDPSLRRSSRNLAKKFPDLYYCAFGMGQQHEMKLSKQPIALRYQDLSLKSKSMVMKLEGIRLDAKVATSHELIDRYIEAVNPYTQLAETFQLYADAVVGVHGEREMESHLRQVEQLLFNKLSGLPNRTKLKDAVKAIKPSPYLDLKDDPCHQKTGKFLYTQENHDQEFLSIDMKHACYQAYRMVDADALPETTWKEFIRQFTPYVFVHQSKQLRLRVMGNVQLHPKYQKEIWESITREIYYRLEEAKLCTAQELVAFNSDELIFRTSNASFPSQSDETLKELLSKWFPQYLLRVERFHLTRIDPEQRYYKKVMLSDSTKKKKTVVFKCVQADQLPQVIKHCEGKEIDETDIAMAAGNKITFFEECV
jgi:hypothetical protein